MKNRRRLILVPLAATAVVLAFASVAYACTTIVGSISTSPTSGTPGTTITSIGSDLQNPAGTATTGGPKDGTTWGLYFLNYKTAQDGMDTCMSQVPFGEEKVGPSAQQAADDTVTISGKIPETAQPTNPTLGPALVCFITERTSGPLAGRPNYKFGTPASEFSVL